MSYNLHPIFVHFPIAFFLLYSLLRILPLEKRFPRSDWRLMRIIILVAGLLGAWLASATGDMAAELIHPNRNILEMHESFANASVFIYFLLFVGEMAKVLPSDWLKRLRLSFLEPLWKVVVDILSPKWFLVLFSILGALSIAMTGLLGGAMVYGTSADPLTAPVLRILGLS